MAYTLFKPATRPSNLLTWSHYPTDHLLSLCQSVGSRMAYQTIIVIWSPILFDLQPGFTGGLSLLLVSWFKQALHQEKNPKSNYWESGESCVTRINLERISRRPRILKIGPQEENYESRWYQETSGDTERHLGDTWETPMSGCHTMPTMTHKYFFLMCVPPDSPSDPLKNLLNWIRCCTIW